MEVKTLKMGYGYQNYNNNDSLSEDINIRTIRLALLLKVKQLLQNCSDKIQKLNFLSLFTKQTKTIFIQFIHFFSDCKSEFKTIGYSKQNIVGIQTKKVQLNKMFDVFKCKQNYKQNNKPTFYSKTGVISHQINVFKQKNKIQNRNKSGSKKSYNYFG